MCYPVPHFNKPATATPLRVFRGIKPDQPTVLTASTCFAMSGSTSNNMSVTRDHDDKLEDKPTR